MKNLKKFVLGAALALGTLTITMTSCTPDACEDVVCKNGGICTDGTCDCVAAYSGSDCDHLITSKWVGEWSCLDTDSVTGTPYSYDASIKLSTADPVKFEVTNFGGFAPSESLLITQNVQDTTEAYLVGPAAYNGVNVSNVSLHINSTMDTIISSYTSNDSTGAVYNRGMWIRK